MYSTLKRYSLFLKDNLNEMKQIFFRSKKDNHFFTPKEKGDEEKKTIPPIGVFSGYSPTSQLIASV